MFDPIRTNIAEARNPAGFWTGLFIGGLAGLGAMMLLAPQSGKKTRTHLWQKSTELQDRVTDTFDDLVALSHFDNRKIQIGPYGKPEESESLQEHLCIRERCLRLTSKNFRIGEEIRLQAEEEISCRPIQMIPKKTENQSNRALPMLKIIEHVIGEKLLADDGLGG
jgi:YtxH-like protein